MGETLMLPDLFWSSCESKILLNPRLPQEERKLIIEAVGQHKKKSVVWLKSSGTESSSLGIKVVCLSKEAILIAAESVNRFFKVTSRDVWLNSLPSFHVGGLSIKARCFLSGASEIVGEKWDVDQFKAEVSQSNVTIVSLVPTQIFDLVKAGVRAPTSLRVVIVGGGALSSDLYRKAWGLGWPVFPSYGMTETAALMASVPYGEQPLVESKYFQLLDHIQMAIVNGQFAVQSEALFEGQIVISKVGEATWQQRPEPFLLDDHLVLHETGLEVLARESELIKILGESVNIKELEERVSVAIHRQVAINAQRDERRGFDLTLYIEGMPPSIALEEINQMVMPFERFKKIVFIDAFPRTELLKVNKEKLFLK